MILEHIKRWLATERKAEKEREMAEKEEATTTERAGRTDNGEVLAAQTETEMETDNWTRVVDLVQSALREGKLTEEAMWQAMVLIPKGKKEYWGIGLVEVMWKVVAAI